MMRKRSKIVTQEFLFSIKFHIFANRRIYFSVSSLSLSGIEDVCNSSSFFWFIMNDTFRWYWTTLVGCFLWYIDVLCYFLCSATQYYSTPCKCFNLGVLLSFFHSQISLFIIIFGSFLSMISMHGELPTRPTPYLLIIWVWNPTEMQSICTNMHLPVRLSNFSSL